MGQDKKTIGILGGISYQSTIKYYELIHKGYFERKRDYYYPEVAIFSLNFQKFTDAELRDDKKDYIDYVMVGIRALQNAGADFIVMGANSVHSAYGEIKKRAKVPLLSIVEVTADAAKKEDMTHLLLLGIKFTMQSSFYQNVFRRNGMDIITPSESEQNEIDRIIFEELTVGNFHDFSKRKLLNIINHYNNVDGVILGCTELPLILRQQDTAIKLLDTLELHAKAALDFALAG